MSWKWIILINGFTKKEEYMRKRLWYETEAADWEREALPLGNGWLGVMFCGGVHMNGEKIWIMPEKKMVQ